MRLDGKTIFISGATSAIGGAISDACVGSGAQLVISGRDPAELERCSERLGSAVVQQVALDLEKNNEFRSVITALQGRFHVDGFVHVAGLHEVVPLRAMRPERLLRAFQVNTVAGIELSRLLAHPKFVELEAGASHLFLSSVASHRAEPGLIAYSAAKAALNSAVRGLAVELAPRRVRVNGLTLGWINTPAAQRTLNAMGAERASAYARRYPLGIGQVADVAAGVLFMLSNESRWMTGSELLMDGGLLA